MRLAAGADSTEITDGFAKCPLCASVPRVRVLSSAAEAVGMLASEQVVPVPVLAAGGIATARGAGAVLAAGASGVRVGTRFIASTEP